MYDKNALEQALADARQVAASWSNVEHLFEDSPSQPEGNPSFELVHDIYAQLTGEKVSQQEMINILGDYAIETNQEITLTMNAGGEDREMTIKPEPETERSGPADTLDDKLQQLFAQDKQLQAMALDKLIQQAETEKLMCENEIDIAVENLTKLHIEAEEALRTGNPVPDNYAQSTQELMSKIEEQREKLEALKPGLDEMYARSKESALELNQNAQEIEKQSTRDRLTEQAKKTMQIVTNGFRSIGNFLHERNEQFRAGTRSAMDRIGDGAQAIYAKTLGTLTRHEERFQTWLKGIGAQAQELGSQVRDKAHELRESLEAGANKVKDAVVKAPQKLGQFARDGDADDRRAKLKYEIGRREESMVKYGTRNENSISANMLYNRSRDLAMKNIDKLDRLADKELARLQAREEKGKWINPETRDKFQAVKQFCAQKMAEVQQAGHREFKPQSLGQDR